MLDNVQIELERDRCFEESDRFVIQRASSTAGNLNVLSRINEFMNIR